MIKTQQKQQDMIDYFTSVGFSCNNPSKYMYKCTYFSVESCKPYVHSFPNIVHMKIIPIF